jgi:hypothetical protein
MSATAYPLDWPIGWKRTLVRARAKFMKKGRGSLKNPDGSYAGWDGNKALTIEQARVRVMDELRRFGVSDWNVIISSNLKLRRDGFPMSGQAQPHDPGVAVYWKPNNSKAQRCMAIDRYDKVQDNLAAIAATLEAMRAIERHGGAAILDRAFTGFAALPAPEQPFQVLGIGANASKDEIDRAYKRLAAEHHPDRGGDEHHMARINAARDQLLDST